MNPHDFLTQTSPNVTLTILRLINIILITLAVTAWIIFYMRYRMIGVIAPISWLIHVMIYGIYRFFVAETIINSDFMHIWTAILLMHSIVLLLVSACMSIPGVKHEKVEHNKEKNNG